jgi:transcriptional regulator
MKVNRRQMVAGLAAGSSGLFAQVPSTPESSLYIPKAHQVEDRKLLHDFVVFRGPHGYISPTWYAKRDVVPTWNFAVVHAAGSPVAITEKAALHDLLTRLVDKYERPNGSGYAFSKLPEDYVSSLMNGIVGFEMSIEALEGKFKLGNDRSETDRQGVLEHLRQEQPRERGIYDFTVSYYQGSRQK